MKHIKIFEVYKDKGYDLVGYPSDKEIIHISQKEFDLINIYTHFIIQWKIKTGQMAGNSSWTYRDDEKRDVKVWLNIYRETGDTDWEFTSAVGTYNL
jgi:hypothetical protein